MKKSTTKPQPIIVIDTREGTPYCFADIPTITKTLPAGDYSLLFFEKEIAIERKTLEDFVHTVIHDRERFIREMEKLQTYKCACVIIECELTDIARHEYTSKAHPNSIFGSAIALYVDYGIPVFYGGNRFQAEIMCKGILIRYWNRKLKEMKLV